MDSHAGKAVVTRRESEPGPPGIGCGMVSPARGRRVPLPYPGDRVLDGPREAQPGTAPSPGGMGIGGSNRPGPQTSAPQNSGRASGEG
jgi:hypothetical protein